MMNRLMNEEAGVLTFEWILLITILVIGVIAGLAAVRDALNCELADVAQAIGSVDQGYYYSGLATGVNSSTVEFKGATHTVAGSSYTDSAVAVTLAKK